MADDALALAEGAWQGHVLETQRCRLKRLRLKAAVGAGEEGPLDAKDRALRLTADLLEDSTCRGVL